MSYLLADLIFATSVAQSDRTSLTRTYKNLPIVIEAQTVCPGFFCKLVSSAELTVSQDHVFTPSLPAVATISDRPDISISQRLQLNVDDDEFGWYYLCCCAVWRLQRSL